MNRNDEFFEIKQALEKTPAELEYITTKAVRRAKNRNRWTAIWKTPVISFCSIAVLFILLVNMFPKVAMAMSNVPFLKELVAAVALDPSLKLAVENDYYQAVGESQSQDNVTVSVDYMILDASHISLFFHVEAPVKEGIYHFELLNDSSSPIAAALAYDNMYETGKLEEIQIEFTDRDSVIPKKMTFQITINVDEDFSEFKTVEVPATDNELTPIPDNQAIQSGTDYDFSFDLYPDVLLARSVDSIPLDQWITIQGQRIYLDCLNIYPTRTRLYIECDKNNSAVLYDLGVYFEDEKGDVYDNRSNGIVAQGSPDSYDIGAIYFESSYFSNAKALTMFITDITLLEKSKLYGDIDFENRTISNMPEGVIIDKMDLEQNTLSFTLKAPYHKPNSIYEVISSEYFDHSGNTYYFGSWSTNTSDNEDYFYVNYQISNYTDNKYRLRWSYAPLQVLEQPIPIKIN
jgi:hypothetical protein